jgi:hypothetical protein
MSAGYRSRDLGRIETFHWSARCDTGMCDWAIRWGYLTSKPKMVRRAREHAASTGHYVMLTADTEQVVSPPAGRGADE